MALKYVTVPWYSILPEPIINSLLLFKSAKHSSSLSKLKFIIALDKYDSIEDGFLVIARENNLIA